MKLKKIEKSKKTPKFQMDLLTSDKELRDKIAVDIQNKYEVLNNISEVEELWMEMKKSLGEVIKENIPKKNPKQHKTWMNKEILDLMEERRKSKNENEKEKCKDLNKEIRKKFNEAEEL